MEKTEESIQQMIVTLGLKDTSFIRESIQNQPSTTNEGIRLLLAAYRANLPKLVKELKVPCLILFGIRASDCKRKQKRLAKKSHTLEKKGIATKALIGGHYAHATDGKALTIMSSFLVL
ncbi:hypothetical protein [Bacillus sp. 1P06AnD]|uniref:hypothetical protein n=1 Tax=Bacillus sp. 1P06AnD TaxID=3132208 RepID=UPI00399F3CA7